MLPQALGKYEFRRVIGRGAMGHVYEAWDTELRRAVAIKLLTLELTEDAHERFRREARAIAALDHPNIVRIHDLGHFESRPYIVMQLLVGRTLADEIASGVIRAVDEKARLAADLCLALYAVHAAGTVHRDVKPANIHLGDDGVIRLVDFGIAHVAGSVLTLPREVLGTPAYMAPEIIAGTPLDGRADIYSLAATLYEWIGGRRPFAAPDIPALFHQILHDAPRPLIDYRSDCPVALSKCIERALSRNAAERPLDALAFRSELLGSLRAHIPDPAPSLPTTVLVSPTGARAGRQWRLWAAVFAAVTLVGTLYALLPGTASEQMPQAPRSTLSPPPVPADGRAAPSRNLRDEPALRADVVQKPIVEPAQPETLPEPQADSSTRLPDVPALEAEEPEREYLAVGTRLFVGITGEIRTDRNRVGDEFTGELREPLVLSGQVVVPAGAVVKGRVDTVSHSPTTGAPFLELSLTSLGTGVAAIPIRTARYRVEPPEAQSGNRWLPLVLGAAAGGIVGGVVAGGDGIAPGAAGGAAVSALTNHKDTAGTYVLGDRLTFKLAQPAEIQKQD